MRDIKFKFWLGHTKKMTYPHTLKDIGKIIPEFPDDIIPLQYTGLKDKNGKEIYEGDILLNNNVKYKVGKLSIFGNVIQGKSGLGNNLAMSSYRQVNGSEIIGNIHENPELIKTL